MTAFDAVTFMRECVVFGLLLAVVVRLFFGRR